MPQMFKINNRVKYNELLMLRARLSFTFLYWKFDVEFNRGSDVGIDSYILE